MLQDSYDIVVVGSGFAGFAAACAAQEQGVRRVLIIDKMPSIGGTSAYSRGVICIPGSEEQRHLGITDDSPELFHSDILVGGQHQNNWELSRILAEEAHSVYDYLKSLGIGFTADIAVLGGHSKKRALFHEFTGIRARLVAFFKIFLREFLADKVANAGKQQFLFFRQCKIH